METIVEELRRDRESGARRLEGEYRAGLMTLARRFCADEGDAEELVNRTFAAVVEGIDGYVEQSAFFGWMCQILSNLHAADVRRKSNRTESSDADAVAGAADADATERLFRDVDASLLRDAVAALPDNMREVLILHYFLDMPVAKIARFLAIPSGTVLSRLHYARLALAGKLGLQKPGVRLLVFALLLAAGLAIGGGVYALGTAVFGSHAESAEVVPHAESAEPPPSTASTPSTPSIVPTASTVSTASTLSTTSPPETSDMNAKTLLAAASLALAASPATATWTYVADAGAWNGNGDKKYSGYVTDGATWSIFVLDLGDGTWQLGAGTWGVDGGSGGSCQAGTTKTSTGIGSGALDVREITADTGMTFTKIGPRCFNSHGAITSITIPDTVVEFGNRAFYGSAIRSFVFENGCPNLATIGSETFRSVAQCAELDLGNTILTTIPNANFDASLGFHRIVFPETLTTLGNQALGWITDGDLVLHFKGPMPTSISGSAIRSRSNSASQKWAFFVDVNTKGTWPVRTDVSFADAQSKFPSVSGETFAEEDYLGYVYPADLGGNGCGTSMKIWVFKEGVPAAVIPATMSVTTTPGRTNATLVATVDLGTSASATVTATVNGVTKTATATQNGTVSIDFDGLTLDTSYPWTATVQGTDDAAATPSSGTVSTLPPEVTLGATSFTQPKDGLSATVSVVVATLTSASADIEFTFDGAVAETRTVTAPGIYDFAVSGLTVGTTYGYSFVAVSSENADEAEVAGTLEADVYHWVYTPGGGWANGCPYTGTISDRNWRIRVWQCDPENHPDEFWLGVGSFGTVGVEAGTGDMDLSSLYADTLAAGTPVKIVKVNSYFWSSHNEFTGLVLPDTVREIGVYAFYGNRGLGSVDLSNTQITNIAARAFQDNYGCTNFFLPKTLQKVGGCAFAWGASKRVFHFRGDVPEVTLTTSDIGTGTTGGDQSFYIGYGNSQQAYCVDSVKFPRWRTDVSTTLYEDGQGNSTFPSGEQSWIPAHVRWGTAEGYKRPFGNSTLGRAFDTSANGRAYLIHETVYPAMTLILIH